MTTRRVVTGNNKDGKSYFVYDGVTPGRLEAGFFTTEEIWIDDPTKPDPDSLVDPVNLTVFKLGPPVGGSLIRIFTFPPLGFVPNITQEEIIKALSRFDAGDFNGKG